MTALQAGAAVTAIVAILLAAVLFRRFVGKALKLAARTGLGLGLLAVLKPIGAAVGLALGVNLPNALVLALLGLPGLGLLMMLHWVTML